MDLLFFAIFVLLGVITTAVLFYFAHVVTGSGKAFIRSRIFLNTDPLIKAFYQFIIGTAFAYLFFLIYFIDSSLNEAFILGEITLGMSLIGFAYLTIPLFSRKKKG